MTYHLRPSRHEQLRNLLYIMHKANTLQDGELMDALASLIVSIDEPLEVIELLSRYRLGLAERVVSSPSYDSEYHVHTDDDVHNNKQRLNKVAYGDFTEAMSALERDIYGADKNIEREVVSDIFDSQFFTVKERSIWQHLREAFLKHGKLSNVEDDIALREARAELRNFMQRYYGPLLPCMGASYLKKDGSHGITMQFIWDDEAFCVVAPELGPELDDYFADHPVESRRDFTVNALPKELAGYVLMDVSHADQFGYETGLEKYHP